MKWTVVGKDDPGMIPGGLNRYAQGLVGGLEANGSSVKWLISGPAVDPNATSTATGGSALRIFRFFVAGLRIRPDVDVINSHFAMYGVPFMFGAALRNRLRLRRRGSANRLKVVVNFQGPWAQESLVAGQKGGIGVRAKARLEHWSLRRADVVIVLSEDFKKVATELGARAERVHVLHPGLSEEWFMVPGKSSPAAEERLIESVSDRQLNLLCVRRLTKRMGHREFLDALQQLDFTIGDRPIQVHLVGRGEQKESIEGWIAAHDRSANVVMHGFLSDEELRELGRLSDIAVVPTLDLEGFGLVVLEAMAMSIPVISTGQGGLTAAMGPWGKSPYIFDVHNAQSLETALVAAAAISLDPDARQGLIRYAHEHSWPKVAGAIATLAEAA